MTTRFVKYNPAFLSEDELVANFVVRQADLDSARTALSAIFSTIWSI